MRIRRDREVYLKVEVEGRRIDTYILGERSAVWGGYEGRSGVYIEMGWGRRHIYVGRRYGIENHKGEGCIRRERDGVGLEV